MSSIPTSAFSDDDEDGSQAHQSPVKVTARPAGAIVSFRLQPAPRDRKSARARAQRSRSNSPSSLADVQERSDLRQDHSKLKVSGASEGKGKFLERLSWDARPTTAELDDGANASLFDSLKPAVEQAKDQSTAQSVEHIPVHIADTVLVTYDEPPQTPRSACERLSSPVPLSAAAAKSIAEDSRSQDANVRLSAQAGSVASIRRAVRASPVTLPRRSSSGLTRGLRRMGSAASLCCSSPLSPTNPNLGQRSREKLKRERDSLVLSLPPMSPLTPKRAENMHTPTAAQAGLLADSSATNDASLSTSRDFDNAPLSATLRDIGAKRSSNSFATSPDSSRQSFNLPSWASKFQANHHRRTLLEDNKQAADGFLPLLKASNSSAPLGLPQLTVSGDVGPMSPNGDLLSGAMDCEEADGDKGHRTRQRAWYRPSELLHLRPGEDVWTLSAGARPSPSPRIQSSVRGHVVPHPSARVSGLVQALKSAKRQPKKGWKVDLPYKRDEKHQQAEIVLPDSKDRRDGWGGVLARASWFSNWTRGPLVSPVPPIPEKGPQTGSDPAIAKEAELLSLAASELTKPSQAAQKPVRRARFKSLQLVEAIPPRPTSPPTPSVDKADDRDWEDVADETDEETIVESHAGSEVEDDRPMLERGVPRFNDRVDPAKLSKPARTERNVGLGSGWQRLFNLGKPAAEPQATGPFLYDQEIFVIGRHPEQALGQREAKRGSSATLAPGFNEKASDDARIRYSQSSVESRPLPRNAWSSKRIAFLTLILALIVSVGLNMALLMKHQSQDQQRGGAQSLSLSPSAMTSSVPNTAHLNATAPSAPAPTSDAPSAPASLSPAISSSSTTMAEPMSAPTASSEDAIGTAEDFPTAPGGPALAEQDLDDRLARDGRSSEIRKAVDQSQVTKRSLPDKASQRAPRVAAHHRPGKLGPHGIASFLL